MSTFAFFFYRTLAIGVRVSNIQQFYKDSMLKTDAENLEQEQLEYSGQLSSQGGVEL